MASSCTSSAEPCASAGAFVRPPTCSHAPLVPQLHMQLIEMLEHEKGAAASGSSPRTATHPAATLVSTTILRAGSGAACELRARPYGMVGLTVSATAHRHPPDPPLGRAAQEAGSESLQAVLLGSQRRRTARAPAPPQLCTHTGVRAQLFISHISRRDVGCVLLPGARTLLNPDHAPDQPTGNAGPSLWLLHQHKTCNLAKTTLDYRMQKSIRYGTVLRYRIQLKTAVGMNTMRLQYRNFGPKVNEHRPRSRGRPSRDRS